MKNTNIITYIDLTSEDLLPNYGIKNTDPSVF
jgi:hypothetical protein